MNSKGQTLFPIMSFVVIVVILVLLAPIMFKLVNTILGTTASTLGNQSAAAGSNVTYVKDTFLSFWDTLIILAFTLSLILLLISAFLIDVHPAFSIIYLLLCFFIILFAPAVFDVVDEVYDTTHENPLVTNSELANYLPLTNFVRNNFASIIIGTMVLSGIITYSKFKFGGGGGV